jgi:hypothetical protein
MTAHFCSELLSQNAQLPANFVVSPSVKGNFAHALLRSVHILLTFRPGLCSCALCAAPCAHRVPAQQARGRGDTGDRRRQQETLLWSAELISEEPIEEIGFPRISGVSTYA